MNSNLNIKQALAAGCLSTLLAQPGFSQSITLDFASARALAHARSDALRINYAETAHREHTAESLKSLHGPKVTAEFRHLWGSKDVDLGTKSISTGIPNIPPISVPLQFSQDLYGPRLIGSIELPIYMGGAISAKVAASEASVAESREDERTARDKLDVTLTQKYFGVQLARSVQKLRESMLSEQNEELKRANRMNQTGSISRIEAVSVAVDRDKAARELIASETDTKIAESDLARLLREQEVRYLSTPLFVLARPIGNLQTWKDKALAMSPVIRAVRAKRNQADQGLKAAKAAWAPQVYAFAQGNAIKHYLSVTEPDWVAGIGVKITLWDNKDRAESVASARALVDKASAGIAEASNQIEQAVETAYLRTRQTQDQYHLTRSSLELARENLRLRQRAFAEGLATSTEVSDARNKLLGAEIARRVSAYQFVVSWASLNAVCGSSEIFTESLSYNDNFIEK